MDFSKFDKQVNLKELEQQIKEAKENTFPEIPAGFYNTKIEKMEIGETKDHRPMFKVQMRLLKGLNADSQEFLSKFKAKKPCIFMNRVLYGTKNDGNMIASVEGWINKIGFEEPIVFEGYEAFADLVLDIAEDCENLLFDVEYDPNAFNSIKIEEVYDA